MSISFRDKILHIDKVLGGVPGLFSRNSAGLVPQAPSGSGTTKFLREDRAWADVAPAQMIAPVESTSTASRAYAVGEQFVYNGLLTEATAAISQGATITVGNSGNAKLADCVADQISTLKDALSDYTILANLNISQKAVNTEIQLSDSITNYKYILFTYRFSATGYGYHRLFFVPLISSNYYAIGPCVSYINAWTGFIFTASNKIKITENGSSGGVYFEKIIGIKS